MSNFLAILLEIAIPYPLTLGPINAGPCIFCGVIVVSVIGSIGNVFLLFGFVKIILDLIISLSSFKLIISN